MNTVRHPRLVMRTPSDFTVNASSENSSLHRPCKAIHFPGLRYSQLNSLKISFNIVSLSSCPRTFETYRITKCFISLKCQKEKNGYFPYKVAAYE